MQSARRMIGCMMHRSRVGSDIPLDQMYGNPAVTKWRQLEDVSLYNDLTYRQEVITIPHETEELAAEFFDELKPVFYSMKILGLFPLQRRNPSEPFRRCILSLLYSILFYFAMNLYAYHVSRVRIEFITSSEASFDELMYSVVHFLYVMPHFYVIPCHWKEVTKVGRYFNLWSDFQKQFFTVTGKQLYLGQKRRARICVVLIPVLALLFVLIEFFMSSANEQIWELGFYWYIFVMILQHVAWWWLVCSCLRGAIASLSTNFFKDPSIFVNERSAPIVAQYRALYMSLARLSRETGLFMCYTYGHWCALCFSVETLSLYGTLSNIHDGMYMKHLGLAMSVCTLAGMLYIIVNSAHHAANEVGTEFSEKLSQLFSNDKQVRRELKIFTQVMTVHSSDINLGGYVKINRKFLLRFTCTLVTYLVVLLQFRLGLLSINTSNFTTVPSAQTAITYL
ncbi:gustatory and odorant receptor 63a-like isoform X2 [Periplaneta americana]|uniref:gustatory and odorant receptor 63a-like isoform X2 n=1 Tax=Periplaneta americana TaxID=6978 RepID=UPI0037E940C3